MKGFWAFLSGLILSILGWIVKKSEPTVQDGQGPGELEQQLDEQIKKDGWDDPKADITDPRPKP